MANERRIYKINKSAESAEFITFFAESSAESAESRQFFAESIAESAESPQNIHADSAIFCFYFEFCERR
ncbi:hypothetical protein [Helicobacter sp. 23-1045]